MKDTESRRVALQQVAEDLHAVLQQFAKVEPICQWAKYTQLQTIFAQQCELREEFVEVRGKSGGNVVQNVSDPDATYRGHQGSGDQVQISETFHEEGLPNLITAAHVETAVKRDADAVEPLLEDLRQRGQLPKEMRGDTSYGSNANVDHARGLGVTLTSPVPGGKAFDSPEVGYDRFTLNEQNEVTACPNGHAPKSTRYNAEQNTVWALIDPQLCAECPLAAHCRVQRRKSTGQPNGRVQFRADAPQSATRRRYEQTPEFHDSYRWRSGIESTNSSLKRRLGLKRLRHGPKQLPDLNRGD
jgi:Transposase DDE domain